jgi:hypothetical protein
MVWSDPFPDMAVPKTPLEVVNNTLDSSLIPPDHKQRIRSGLEQFRQEHGQRLVDLGWNRETLFFGAIPEEAKTYDELHGIAALLADGWRLVHSTFEMLIFGLEERRLTWLVEGHFIGWRVGSKQ